MKQMLINILYMQSLKKFMLNDNLYKLKSYLNYNYIKVFIP